jgi:hypothetical protein
MRRIEFYFVQKTYCGSTLPVREGQRMHKFLIIKKDIEKSPLLLLLFGEILRGSLFYILFYILFYVLFYKRLSGFVWICVDLFYI